jgi:hypothetical protein
MTLLFNKPAHSINDFIENLLRKYLIYFFLIIFITTVLGSFNAYLDHNRWNFGDWLINYQGGMVRRGFLGETVYIMSQLTHINPGLFILLFQIIFYALFFIFSYLLLKRQHFLLPYILLIFSPFIFTYQLNDSLGGYRKEIIFFAILSFIVYTAKTLEYKVFEKIFYITLLLFPALILTHEMLAIYLPYLLIPYISITNLTKRKIIFTIFCLLPSIISFITALYYANATTSQINEILYSHTEQGYTIEDGGAVAWLNKTTSYGRDTVISAIKYDKYLIYYSQVFLLSLIAFIPIGKKLSSIFKKRLSMIFFIICLSGSIVLIIIAKDWGRFIYINLVSLFLLSLLPKGSLPDNKKISHLKEKKWGKLNLFMIPTFFILYSSLWHIPHCCEAPYPQNYKLTNPLVYIRPWVKIILNFKNKEINSNTRQKAAYN